MTYDLGGGKSVVRGGYGRFYDKTHFELIGGLYTGTPFTNSFTVNFPTAAADAGPRNGQLADRSVSWSTARRSTARCSNSSIPGGQLLRNTGASWDNADRRTPYTDQVTVGYERQLAEQHGGERRLRARVQPRPADVEGPEPGPARDDRGDLTAGPAGQRDAERGGTPSCSRNIPASRRSPPP